MSYEGYEQYICKNGHYWCEDALTVMYAEDSVRCPKCKEKPIWENSVNTTNGSYDNGKRIDGYVALKPHKTKTCKCCGTVLEQLFKPPKGKGRSYTVKGYMCCDEDVTDRIE